ncbi:Uncharacterised protein [Bartonella vinsonii]|uniref:Uncharacterized protein n=1 Tax=Bartonella vinsonii TaxID=33047 RepID=A0A448V841_BARVI|nr:Uncharacterised protein [Bartonella vinsonii]
MGGYLQTFYQGIPLYYAGKVKNTIRLDPQKHNAVFFISQQAAECVAKNLAEQYLRNDFSLVQEHNETLCKSTMRHCARAR